MDNLPGDHAALLPACQAIVDQLCAERDWQLLDRYEWAQQTLGFLSAGGGTDARRAAIYTYSHALHAACSGEHGEQRRELGYTELFRYLYDIARRRYPLIYEDVAQQALGLTYQHFERCRSPGTFLAFALQRLLAAARAERRLLMHERAGLQPIELPQAALGSLADLAGPVIDAELRATFVELSAGFLRKHPRAATQLAALRLKYIDGLEEAEICRRLGKPPSSVYVLRARAIEKLRAEPEWRSLAIELGVLPDEHEQPRRAVGSPSVRSGDLGDHGEVKGTR